MKASININLDIRRKLSDETYPIVLRVVFNRNSRTIPLDYSIPKEAWDPVTCMIKKESKVFKNITRVNNHIHSEQMKAQEILDKLIDSGEIKELSITELKNLVTRKETQHSFKVMTEKIIAELREARKLGNAGVYQQALDFMERMTGLKDIAFADIDYKMLKAIESKFLSIEGNSLNGLSFYLRTVRAVYNRAIKEGKARRENYPFTSYSIKETKTRKRAIRKTDMDNIKAMDFIPGSALWHTRNIFLFSFFNRGMNFADIAKLQISDIVDDRIYYRRSKTGKPLSVKLIEPTIKILNFYTEAKGPDDRIFPILKRDTPELQQMDLYNSRKTFNKYLNKIAEACGIQGRLTSYVARHSWATIAKDLNVPISVISEGLGHEDIKTTQIYLDEFDTSVIDDANQLITG